MSYGVTLALDGSTYEGSVAVLRDSIVLAERALEASATPGRGGRDELFLPMVAECLAEAGAQVTGLDRIVCGGGPGSFTSLRIAASIAKGLAVGAGCPLFAVSSLLLIVARDSVKPGRYLAILPAMRGESFAALFEVGASGIIELAPPALVADSDLPAEARRLDAILTGPAADGRTPHARGVATVLPFLVAAGECDVQTWEPTYGRLAEAQVKWEQAHGRPLTAAG